MRKGSKHSDLTIEKMRTIKLGKKLSKTNRKRIGESLKRRYLENPELRKEVSIRMKKEYKNGRVSYWKNHMNHAAGWCKGKKLTKKHRQNIREGTLRAYREGRKVQVFSLESRKKMSTSHLGQKPSKRCIRLLRKRMLGKDNPMRGKGRCGKESPMYGRKHTEETIRKIRAARLKQKFPKKDTKPEKAVQELLRSCKISFETHKSILGNNYATQPDIFIDNANLCVFVDGCYWHGCSECNKTLSAMQQQRIDSDRKINKCLTQDGFKVIRIWEHDINNNQLEKYFK